MKILPVLDLLDGVVVRGVAGERDSYRPVESCLVDSADPLEVAEAFRRQLGLTELYLADLDAILHGQRNLELIGTLAERGFSLLVDAGLNSAASTRAVLDSGAAAAVTGLETLTDPALLGQLVNQWGPERVVFSLDLKCGQPLTAISRWRNIPPLEIVREAADLGISRLIVLDLAQVGLEEGLSTLPLCRQIRRELPELELITGGGISDGADLQPLEHEPVDGLLVATALHRGRMTRDDVQRYSAQ